MSKRKFTGEPGSPYKPPKKKQKTIVVQPRIVKQINLREIKYRGFYWPRTALTNIANNASVGTTAHAGPTEGSFSVISKGDEIYERTGRKVAISSFMMRWQLHWVGEENTATFTTPNPVRMALVIDKQCNGAVADSTADSQVFEANGMMALINDNTFGRFRVLKDFYIQPGGQCNSFDDAAINTAAYGGWIKMGKLKYKFKEPLIVNYNSQSIGDIRDVVDNNLYLICYHGDLTHVGTELSYVARVGFTDM